ncbi:Leucine-zipper-like transcriptional regulator 1 [Borealophlyctis nickersoniae]|nr:Leucine-zipper-like transcriptional regulator 1 [Borealophlyctis nickersoniae]
MAAQRLGLTRWIVVGAVLHPPQEESGTSDVKNVTVPGKSFTHCYLHQQELTKCITILHIPFLSDGALFGDEKTADFTFVVQGHELPAHVNMLKRDVAGRYFTSIVTQPFKELAERKVQIADVKRDVFKGILQYIYTGRAVLGGGKAWNLVDLYCAADRFQVTSFLPFITAELLIMLQNSPPTFNELFQLVQRTKDFSGLSEVVTMCVRTLMQQWDEAQKCEMWKEMSREDVEIYFEKAAQLLQQSSEKEMKPFL